MIRKLKSTKTNSKKNSRKYNKFVLSQFKYLRLSVDIYLSIYFSVSIYPPILSIYLSITGLFVMKEFGKAHLQIVHLIQETPS